jgi:ribosomal protein L12E/L44/L45/RPP1/RPP2
MAFLNRALVLAQADSKPDKDKTIDRISKLIEKENVRHDKAMAGIQSPPAAAATAAAIAPAPSAASEATGGSK